MTHDQHAKAVAELVYRSCQEILPTGRTFQSPCLMCGFILEVGFSRTVADRLEEHDEHCPLRIVIEAALNTEKQSAWITELLQQWPRIINGTEQMICWTGELEAYTPAPSNAVQEIVGACLAARAVEDCRVESSNTESEGA